MWSARTQHQNLNGSLLTPDPVLFPLMVTVIFQTRKSLVPCFSCPLKSYLWPPDQTLKLLLHIPQASGSLGLLFASWPTSFNILPFLRAFCPLTRYSAKLMTHRLAQPKLKSDHESQVRTMGFKDNHSN